MNRRNLSFRTVTHVAQNTEIDATIVDDFVNAVRDTIDREQFSPDQVVNMDETNIQFDEPVRRTINVRGARNIALQTTGSSSSATVVLAVTMNGKKLKPFIIFKGSPTGRIVREFRNYPEGAHYACQKRNWMDIGTMNEWIRLVWKQEINGALPSYLLWDVFAVHKMPAVIEQLEEFGTQVDFIPPGYTSTLQVHFFIYKGL
jgi:hypothetical protein